MADLDLAGGQDLAEDVRERQPQVLDVVAGDHAGGDGGLGHVRPVVVREPYALGAAGGAGGVDQRGELVGGDGRDPLLDRLGVLGEVLLAARLQVGEGEHPALRVALGRYGVGGLQDHHVGELGQVGAALARLGQLSAVLGDQHAAGRVGEDERRLLGVGARVDRGHGTAGAHDAQVGEDPLDAGVGGERDPLLGLQTEVQQARGDTEDPLGRLAPAQRLPVVGASAAGRRHREPVGLGVRRGGDTLKEECRHGGRAVLDQGLCVAHGRPPDHAAGPVIQGGE